MKIVDIEIEKYCTDHSSEIHPALHSLERETNLKTLAPQMLSGALQGQFIKMLCEIHRPLHILEIGTFTGYATICMALGSPSEAHILTLEVNPELKYISNLYFQKAGVNHKITSLNVDAAVYLKEHSDLRFDMVFIDAGKLHNALYYKLIFDQLNPGCIILVDNTLWSGKVLDPLSDRTTQCLHEFNVMLREDPRVEKLILPFRDGLTVIRKL